MTTNTDPSVGLIDAVCTGDTRGLAATFAEDVRMRAALPIGVIEEQGAASVTALFDLWFGSADQIQVLEVTRVTVGDKLRLSWRLRAHYETEHLQGWFHIEQVAFVDGGDRLHTLELACSGFQPEQSVSLVA